MDRFSDQPIAPCSFPSKPPHNFFAILAPSPPPHFFGGLLFVILLTTALLAGSCDISPGVNSEHEASELSPDSVQISLLESGRMVTGLSGSRPLRMRTVDPGKKSGSISLDAKHACTMMLYRPDGPRGPGYYVRSAEITYPDSVLAQADGETKTLRHRLGGPAVPHPSGINVQLQCRLPDVEGAETRVERFFRLGAEQLKATGFVPTDTATTSGTSSQNGLGSIPTLMESDPPSKGKCWWERKCKRGPDGELYDCTEWQFKGCDGQSSGSGGNYGGTGSLPSQPCSNDPCPMIYPDDMDGGPSSGPGKRIPSHDYNPEVDTVKIDELPDCSLSDSQAANQLGSDDIDLDEWKDYCESSQPNSQQTQRILDAINRIADRGSVCAQIARRARLYLRKDLIYLDPTPTRMSGFGHPGLVVFWSAYVDRYHDDRTKEDDGWKMTEIWTLFWPMSLIMSWAGDI